MLRIVAFQIWAIHSTVIVPAMVLGTAPKKSTAEEMSNFLGVFFEGNTGNIVKQLGMAIKVLRYNKDNCAIKGKW